jgi:hypothetical protein
MIQLPITACSQINWGGKIETYPEVNKSFSTIYTFGFCKIHLSSADQYWPPSLESQRFLYMDGQLTFFKIRG